MLKLRNILLAALVSGATIYASTICVSCGPFVQSALQQMLPKSMYSSAE